MGNEEESNLLPTPATISSCQQTIPNLHYQGSNLGNTRVMSPQLSQLSYSVLVPTHVLAFHTQFSPVMNQGALL